eukprot:TRINITY_DN972_c0_g1_i1.p1 TRINITY_DN972_c0_g1~~TRINITY_DN972_c0_g1_i1.p1  ORF type:complete len:112 (+),score=19.77 TRINITY_DN972_c0_g1_i1:113-448(+)
MAGVGKKCDTCGKTAYKLESVDNADLRWHKLCFKCSEEKCKLKLNVKTFVRINNKPYCEKCGYKIQTSTNAQSNDSMSVKLAVNAPKVGVINEQVRGKEADQQNNSQTGFL